MHGKLNSSAFNAKRKLSKVGVQVGFFWFALFIFKKSSSLAQQLRRKEKGLSVDRPLKMTLCHHFGKILNNLHIVFY